MSDLFYSGNVQMSSIFLCRIETFVKAYCAFPHNAVNLFDLLNTKRLVFYIRRLLPCNDFVFFYWEKLVTYLPLYFLAALQKNEGKGDLDEQEIVCLILDTKSFCKYNAPNLSFFLCFKCFTQ